MYNETGLLAVKKVDELCKVFADSNQKIRDGYRLLEEAEKEMTAAYGAQYSEFATIDHYQHQSGQSAAEFIIMRHTRLAWKCLIDRIGIRKVLSVRRAEELDKQFSSNRERDWGRDKDKFEPFPALTPENIYSMLTSQMDAAKAYGEEAVKEVFEFLRPAKCEWQKTLKTNEKNAKFAIGEKLILQSWYVEYGHRGGGKFRVKNGSEKNLMAMDRVFHMLDGAGIPEGYVSPLIDSINTSKTGIGETEYFAYKCYGNGNLHLKFKRMDLVQMLNQIASDQTQLKDGKHG